MGRIHYVVATSLGGYVASPNCEAHWILRDPVDAFPVCNGKRYSVAVSPPG
jgi:hypothetical protein